MKIKTKSDKKLNMLFKTLFICAGITFCIIGLINSRYYEVVVGIFLILVSSYQKEVYLSSKGIAIKSKGFLFKHFKVIPYETFTDLQIKRSKTQTKLLFFENNFVRKLVIDSNEVKPILQIVKKQNKSIKIIE